MLKVITHEELRAPITNELRAQTTSELRAHGAKLARRVRPLTADTDLAEHARGTGNTLDQSVQLVRSALAQMMRSARKSFATCRGALSACRSTGNHRTTKPPAYCGRPTAPTRLAWLEAYTYIGIIRPAAVVTVYRNRPACDILSWMHAVLKWHARVSRNKTWLVSSSLNTTQCS